MAPALAAVENRCDLAAALLWEVGGRTSEPVTCAMHRAGSGTYVVSVALRDELVYVEEFEGEADAIRHAAFLCDDYVDSGWTLIVRRDARLGKLGA